MEVTIKEIEVAKLNLQPGEVLSVTIKSDEVTQADMGALKTSLDKIFPHNKVFLICVPTGNDVKYDVLKPSEASSDSDSVFEHCKQGEENGNS